MRAAYVLDVDKTWSETRWQLEHCFEMWGIATYSIVPNVPESRCNHRTLSQVERGVTVTYENDGKPISLSLDEQVSPAMNLRAIFLCLDSLRLIDYRGLGDLARSAYLQLEAPKASRDPYEVLGLRPGASADMVKAMHRELAKKAHPDHGGSAEAMVELNTARDELLRRVGS